MILDVVEYPRGYSCPIVNTSGLTHENDQNYKYIDISISKAEIHRGHEPQVVSKFCSSKYGTAYV
jgi:hypothetical protein